MRVHFFFLSKPDSQSSPSYKPSPDVAHVAWMYLVKKKGLIIREVNLHIRNGN